MSESSSANPTRCLRLERLENRSLLACGLMAVGLSEFANVDGGFDQLDQPIPNHHAPAQNNTAQSNTAQSNTAQSNANQAVAGDLANRGRQQPPNPVGAQQLQRPDPPPLATGNSAASGNVAVAFSPSDAFSAPSAPGVDAVLTSFSSVLSDSSDVANEVATDSTAGEVSTINAANSPTRITLGQPADSSGITVPEMIDLDSAQRGGTVDLTPLLPGPFPQADNSSEDAWKLNREILPRLKQAIEISPAELAQLADKVVTQWFGGPGGMVAVDQVQLPSGRFTLDNAIVDIRLESTVTLYRPLDLFTAASTSPIEIPMSDEALDTIMKTIGQLAESETQPVASDAPYQISAIAYPALAVVTATGAAISARQRSKKAERLEHSLNRKS